MERLLRWYLWTVDGVVIALCMIFLARASSTVIERNLLSRGSTATQTWRQPATTAPVYTKEVEDILKRNIFCSTCPPIVSEDGSGPGPTTAAAPPLQPTSLNLKLLAIMFAPRPTDPRRSVAIIRDNDGKSAGPYYIGSQLRAATIDEIAADRVYLDFGGGRREYLDLLDHPRPAPIDPVTAALPKPADPLAAELDRGIKKLGEHTYEVQRSTLDTLLGNMPALAVGARIVPEAKDGKPAGFRLLSLRPDVPFTKIGLQNGDVVAAINGLDMNSPDEALLAYTKLKTANHLSVAILRNGQKITKDYNIR